MNNSMVINLGKGNDSTLPLVWKSVFKDNTEINQINMDGTENKFELVQNRFPVLKEFWLMGIAECFIVDLEKGTINRGRGESFYKESKKENIRLIYFLRKREYFSQDGDFIKLETHYFLGFQYNENNLNRKIILEIDEDGNFIIIGE